MWIMMNNCFFSIVKKDCADDELLVRARREGDIESVFPNAAVKRTIRNDYRYRAVLKRDIVMLAIASRIGGIDYGNFKNTVHDRKLHDAYMHVWGDMEKIQDGGAYGRFLWVKD